MVGKLKSSKPTVEWKKRMEEDELFTVENIQATDEVLDLYLNQLKDAKGVEQDILRCVKEVVLSLNDLNEEFDYFIETIEREELYEFITEAANLAGLETEEDITEEWREW
ncbi:MULTISPECIES: hypothetical protein [Bacillaceae]|uniref:hypothetical protein n=1 Tax=Bacillaceae TaxID=186817 RepID=UPI001042BA8E|nr:MULTISPECIES: hypothetical protein [Bacillaceae]MDT2047809.1 hypothetical protein [Priestia flexa]TDB55482.1 hypothetical protein EPL02_04530 [Bacillus sp. CBEL-1]USY56099.1 hypothetical protein NIZ91_05430 [Bacillus sp. 1780r2a1]